MQYQLCVLLYSKYSNKSNQLLSAIGSCPIDLASSIGLTSVCIDNKDVRNKIMKSKNISIITVPTILLIYHNGNIEKYEGKGSFDWIEEMSKQFIPPPPPPPTSTTSTTTTTIRRTSCIKSY